MARISVFPYWTTNPYLNMLYMEARSQGWRVDGKWRYHELLNELQVLAAGDILHIHWTSPVAENVKDAAELRSRITRLDGALSGARARGVEVFWTVHNTISHDTEYHAEEVELAKVLARRSSRIIVLNSQTAEVVSEYYELPAEKVSRVRHASYRGVYEPSPGRRAARRRIGTIPPGDLVIGIVGGIRPYKGLGDLLRAAGLLAERNPRVSMLLAGGTTAEAMAEIEAAMPGNVTVHRRHGQLTDEEVVTWASACDLFALPYTRILNSGSMLLAATLGVPCVVPGEPHLLAEYGDEQWVEFFDIDATSRVDALAEAIERGLDRQNGARAQAAEQFAASYTMHDMSVDFAELLPR